MARLFGFLTFNFLDLEIVPLACLLQLDFRHKFAMYCAILIVLMLVIKIVGYSVARGGATKENLEAAFVKADADKNGTLDTKEVSVLVRTMHLVGGWVSMTMYTAHVGSLLKNCKTYCKVVPEHDCAWVCFFEASFIFFVCRGHGALS